MLPNFLDIWAEYLCPLIMQASPQELDEMRIDSTLIFWASMVAEHMGSYHRLTDGRIGEADITGWSIIPVQKSQVVSDPSAPSHCILDFIP